MPEPDAATKRGAPAAQDERAIEEFVAGLHGELLCADDGYEVARRVWNGVTGRKPALIARCTGVADVVASVNFAREHGLLIVVRGGGHGVCDGGLVIDLEPMIEPAV